ncbi:MAG TPA: nucleotide sugar dehydrogenase [Methanomicrobiales archaeon]|nr:nucleotide sugar dehydrogenase [Methanomicrobiales archaeon]
MVHEKVTKGKKGAKGATGAKKVAGTTPVLAVVGLGYVGLPLAAAFAREFPTIGFDIDPARIREVARTNPQIQATADPARLGKADYLFICVPTPVTAAKQPDLGPVCSAGVIVGRHLKPGATVVLESTVYPGVTEGILREVLERESGLTCGDGFRIGYSPERINPGDPTHTLATVVKVVAGMDGKTTEDLARVYGRIAKVFPVRNIRIAEAAKVIENIQRDLNIALMNELSIIFHLLGLDTREVLAAAGTKWNFLPFTPGLVGGHCIPVDPYYLVASAQERGYHPQVILAGRAINDSMPAYVARMAVRGLNDAGKVIRGSRVLVMGLTYKENVPDIRESPAEGIVKELEDFGVEVYGHDPLVPDSVLDRFGVRHWDGGKGFFDAIIITVAHEEFRRMALPEIRDLFSGQPVLVDVRGMVDAEAARSLGISYQRL